MTACTNSQETTKSNPENNLPEHIVEISKLQMAGMFRNATSFNSPLNFDTEKVENFSQMFYQATSFNQDLLFNTSAATNMNHMFARGHHSISHCCLIH